MSIIEKIDKTLNEAEEVPMPDEVKGVLSMMGIKPEGVKTFSGVHGKVVSTKGDMPIRIHKKDFNKLKNKNIRWLDIKSIGLK